jgi:hypothetical protein
MQFLASLTIASRRNCDLGRYIAQTARERQERRLRGCVAFLLWVAANRCGRY